MDFKTPLPRYEFLVSPMPAYTIEGLLDEKEIAPTARSAWSSETGTKEVPRFDDRQIPPVPLPTSTMRESEGEMAIEFILPLVRPRFGNAEVVGEGPMARHVVEEA